MSRPGGSERLESNQSKQNSLQWKQKYKKQSLVFELNHLNF